MSYSKPFSSLSSTVSSSIVAPHFFLPVGKRGSKVHQSSKGKMDQLSTKMSSLATRNPFEPLSEDRKDRFRIFTETYAISVVKEKKLPAIKNKLAKSTYFLC